MPKNNSINGIHAQRLKAIRKYINFDYDLRKPLSNYQKRKIKQYHDEIDALTARPNQVYRPKDKGRLRKAQQFAQHEKYLPGLDVAFIPTDGKTKAKIRFDKSGDIVAVSDHVITRGLELETDKLLIDPIAHVNEVIKRDPHAKQFTVKAGRYEIPVPVTRATVANYVARLTARYSDEGANNYHGNWLHGLNSHTFKNQATFDEYQMAKNAAKRELQRERRNAKRREKRKQK